MDITNTTIDRVALLIGVMGAVWFVTYLVIVIMYIFLGITNESW